MRRIVDVIAGRCVERSLTLLLVAVVVAYSLAASLAPAEVEVRPDAFLPNPRAIEAGNLGPVAEETP